MSRERPILFSGSMVRAILDGHKTQTRRLVRPQPNGGPSAEMVDLGGAWGLSDGCLSGEWCCPYGVPGARLWVRETWAVGACADTLSPVCLSQPMWIHENGGLWYAAGGDPASPFSPCGRWRPSIHMPRWASRITLEVTEVRVQRLQDISEEDAEDEGTAHWVAERTTFYANARTGFAALWDSINAKRGHGWDANPWVWAITFQRLEAKP